MLAKARAKARATAQPGRLYSEDPVVLDRPSDSFIEELSEVGTSDDVIVTIAASEKARANRHSVLETLASKLTGR